MHHLFKFYTFFFYTYKLHETAETRRRMCSRQEQAFYSFTRTAWRKHCLIYTLPRIIERQEVQNVLWWRCSVCFMAYFVCVSVSVAPCLGWGKLRRQPGVFFYVNRMLGLCILYMFHSYSLYAALTAEC